MRETPTTAALIEFSHSHYECLYSQLQFLSKSGYAVHVIVPNEARDEAKGLEGAAAIEYIDIGTGTRGRWNCISSVKRYLQRHDIRAVLLNTAEGNYVRDFCLIVPRSVRCAGTIHHTNKLHKSFTQKVISRYVHKYFVLNDYLLSGIPSRYRERVRSYYPIFFPPAPPSDIQKPDGEFWIAVPGIVEFRRRDYRTLFSQLRRRRPGHRIKFFLLGPCSAESGDGAEVRSIVRAEGWENDVVLFSGFVERELFAAYLQRCDLILPLIHPETALYDNYGTWQISGAYNLSFGYGIPMLVHRAMSGIEDFHTAGFFYTTDTMMDVLNDLAGDRAAIAAKGNEIRSAQKFLFETQRERFIRFLEQSERDKTAGGER